MTSLDPAVAAALQRNVMDAILHLNAATRVAVAHGLQVELTVAPTEPTLDVGTFLQVEGLVTPPLTQVP